MRKWRKGLSFLLAASMLVSTAFVSPQRVQAETKENVALHKTVTVAPGMPEAGKELITDGAKARGWDKSYMYHTSAEAEDTATKPYITIDLGESYDIDQIVYFGVWPPDAGYYNTSHNMVIQVSNDADFADETTKTVYNTDVNNFFGFGAGTDAAGLYQEPKNGEDGISVEFPTTNARYVRYYQHGATQQGQSTNCWPNALTVGELEVYTAGGEIPVVQIPEGNAAYQAEVTGSAFNSKGAATNGWWGGYGRNDLSDLTCGSVTDNWKAPSVNEDGELGELVYVQMKLKKAQDINTIQIWSKGGFTYLAQIVQISEDGKNWTNVYNSDTDNKAGQDPSDSGKTVCGGKLANGTLTGVKAGADEAYAENGAKTIAFDTTKAQYIRWWCSGNSTGNSLPQMIQLQAYKKCIVTFDYRDGDKTEKVSVTGGSNISRPETPVYSVVGKLFDRWTVNEVGGKAWDFGDPVTEDMMLVANWMDADIHTVTFDSDGGTEIAPIQVTDSLAVVRPENPSKEGAVFAGWKLNKAPYNFGSPVTGDITLTATWVEPAQPDAVVLRAGLLDMTLDSHGQVTKLVSTLDGTDYYSDGPDGKYRSLVSLIADYHIETPTSVSYDENAGILTFGFASINATAEVTVKKQGDYTSLTLSKVEKPDGISIQAILWGPIKNTITTGGQTVGTAYDETYAIGMHMLNTKTIGGWPIEYKNDFYAPDLPTVNGYADSRVTRNIYSNTAAFSTWGSALQAYTWDYTKDTMRTIAYFSEVKQMQPAMTGKYADELASMIGSSVALYGTRRDNILNVISNIQIKEGLPHITINGQWQKTSVETGQDFLVFNDAIWGLDVVENDAKMANAAGINYIYGQYGAGGPWNGDGSYEFNGLFGGSDENARLLVEKAAEYDVYVGTHTLSNLISWGTKYMTPEASSALSYAGFAGLTREAAASDTELYVKDGHPFSNEVVGASGGSRLLRIDKELVTFTDCVQVGDGEWKLTGCTRGVNGTKAADYVVSENVYKLWAYYTCPALGGWESIEPMTSRMGEVYGDIGIHCMSYDSFESTKYSVYSSMLPAMYMKSVYNEVKEAGKADGFLTEASDMDTNVWDVHSRISWGESNTPIHAMMNYLNYYEQNFFPCMLGWMYDHGNHGGYGKAQLLMNLSMKGGWNAGAGWYVNRNTFNSYPYMAEMLKTWNNAIQKGAFVVGGEYTKELQNEMKNAWINGKVWTLTETVADKEWTLQQVNKANLEEKIGEPVTLYATNKIAVEQTENGDIATSASRDYSRVHEGDVVTVYEQAFDGYRMKAGTLTVTGVDGAACDLTPVEGESGAYTFTMPAQDVTITAEFEAEKQETDKADKYLLQATYDYAQTLSTDGVTASAKAFFEKALAAAKVVLEDEEAVQAEVDQAWDNLLKGIWGLGIVKGDKTYLEQLIWKAESMMPNADKYVESYWPQLTEALEAGKGVFNDEDALDEDIEPVVDTLLNAILAQRFKADKSNLQELINKASGIDLTRYTEESVSVLKAAMRSAKAVMDDVNLSTDDQTKVDEAAKELNDAIERLVKEASVDGDSDDKNNTEEGGGKNGSAGDNSKPNAPKTGDQSDGLIWMFLVIAAFGIAMLVVRKKREDRKYEMM